MATTQPARRASCRPRSRASAALAVLSTPRTVPTAPATAMTSDALPRMSVGFRSTSDRMVCTAEGFQWQLYRNIAVQGLYTTPVDIVNIITVLSVAVQPLVYGTACETEAACRSSIYMHGYKESKCMFMLAIKPGPTRTCAWRARVST